MLFRKEPWLPPCFVCHNDINSKDTLKGLYKITAGSFINPGNMCTPRVRLESVTVGGGFPPVGGLAGALDGHQGSDWSR